MNLLDDLSAVLGGAGKRAEPVPLQAGEQEIFRTPGVAMTGGLSLVGGDIVVTNQRLIFTPLDVQGVASLLKAGLRLAGAPGVASVVVARLASLTRDSRFAEPSADIRGGRDGSVTSPPTVLATAEGTTVELGVLSHRLSPNFAASNMHARQRLLAAVRTQSASTNRNLPGPAPRVTPQVRVHTTAALTEAEIDANAVIDDQGDRIRIFLPMARAKSTSAIIDPALVGTWELDADQTLTLMPDGELAGRLQLFGALPVGQVRGNWWRDGTPSALVINLVCMQSDGQSTIECAMSWPFVIEHSSNTTLTVVDSDGERLTLVRGT